MIKTCEYKIQPPKDALLCRLIFFRRSQGRGGSLWWNDRSREGGAARVRWESFILAKGLVFKPWLYLRFFVVVVFFFSCQGGALCPAQGLQLLKRGAVVNTVTVDEEWKNRGRFWVQLRNEIFATRTWPQSRCLLFANVLRTERLKQGSLPLPDMPP